MKKGTILLLAVLLNYFCFSQSESDKELAYKKAGEAIKLMDNGEIEKSIQLLEESCKLDPDNTIYPYEMGFAYYLAKNYTKAIKIYKKVTKMKGSTDQAFQMLGNAYDMVGKRPKAIDSYEKGLGKFPHSGKLYLELGNVHQSDWNKALEFYEKGIEVDPLFPSNYYWASKIFCNSTEEMWGMLYGEIFMNIERGSPRTEEISKLLYDTYKSEISFPSDSTIAVSFCQNHIISNIDKGITLPFSMIYEPGLMLAVAGFDTIDLESLHKIRQGYISYFFDKKHNKTFPNVVFDWHKKLIDEKQFECYNYWLLMKGAPDEFSAWIEENQDKFDSFIDWFTQNPMTINGKNKFHRFNY